MIIFEDGQERIINRKHALGIKQIVLADDVNRGDEVKSEYVEDENGSRIVISKSDEPQLDDNGDPVYTFITKEFGLYGSEKGLKSLIEIKFCDDGTMFLNLIAGSIAIRPEGQVMTASRAVDKAKLPNCNSSEILWINAEKLISYMGYITKFGDRYPYDYEYFLEISGSFAERLESFSVKKHCDANDISCGALAIKEAEEQKKAQAKEARKMVKMFSNYGGSNDGDFDFDTEDSEDDYDDSDDEEFDY